jgi:agmatine deiminase
MIIDQQTTTVYFSNELEEENRAMFYQLRSIIEDNGYKTKLLIETKDFYCRDYMPVQVDDYDFVQFVFRPEAYLTKEEYLHITNPAKVQLFNKLPIPRYSPIILDGGNIIKWNDKVIITERVLIDNAYQFPNDKAIIKRLKSDLKCDVIIIPEYPNEKTGHADGLIRFIDEKRVFINETRFDPNKKWLNTFLSVLDDVQLTVIEIPCEVAPNQDKAHGLYINYLHVGNLIIVPQFGFAKSDKRAIQIMNQVFGETHTIVPFESKWISEYGGVLNCSSWGIR